MRVLLDTIRYGIIQPFDFHGSHHSYDANNGVLYVYEPVQENDSDGFVIGMVRVVTITAGDTFVVLPCGDDCTVHDAAQKRAESFPPVQVYERKAWEATQDKIREMRERGPEALRFREASEVKPYRVPPSNVSARLIEDAKSLEKEGEELLQEAVEKYGLPEELAPFHMSPKFQD